jgi:hypothetical protein
VLADRLEHILQKLNGVKKQKNGYKALCPAHPDRNPSLSIRLDGDKVLIHCHAGCKTDEVLAAVGLTYAELDGNDRRDSTKAEPNTCYIYENEESHPVYGVQRTPDKKFTQFRVMSDGQKFYGLGEGWFDKKNNRWEKLSSERNAAPTSSAVWYEKVVSLPFKLPEVIRASNAGQKIFICEGEKDVLNIIEKGGIATTNSGGAGKWIDDFSRFFVGSEVVIVADKDAPGIAHAEQVAKSLSSAGVSNSIMTAREGKDASDHLKAGFGLDEFVPYLPERANQSIIKSLSEIEPEVVGWLWCNYIPLKAVTLLGGDPGKGKTRVALAIAAMLSRGESFPGSDEKTEGRTLIVTLEEPAGQIRKRIEDLDADLSKIDIVVPDEEFRSSPLSWFQNHSVSDTFKLIIFDPLQCFVSHKADMQVANKSRHEMNQFIRLAESSGAAVLIICHPNKQEGNKPIYRFNGSLDIVGAARSALYLSDRDDKIVLSQIKSNLGPKAPNIEVIISEEGTVSFGDFLEDEPKPKSAVQIAKEFILTQLSEVPMLSDQLTELASLLGISKSTMNRARKDLGSRLKCQKRSDGMWELSIRTESDPKENP